MLRAFSTVAALFAAAAPGAGHPVAESPTASVKVLSCSPALGSAIFYGRMRSLEPGERMSMRFTLLERTADGRWEPVQAPRLGRWRRSRPGVGAFGYRQKVKGLERDAVYRARVDFRWNGADGTVVRRARRKSRPCSQAGPLPNLRVRITGAGAAATPGASRYALRLVNAGDGAAEQVGVALEVDGSIADTRTVERLEAGQAQELELRGPACKGSVRAIADQPNSIRESSESDNIHELTCDQLPRG
jgi:hypothetical protein